MSTAVDDAIRAEVESGDKPDDASTTGSGDRAPDRSATSSKRKPNRRGSGKSKSSGKGGRKSLHKPLEELLTMVGTAAFAFDPFDGTVILERADKLARALDQLAKDNPTVDRALRLLVEGSGWGAVATAVAGIAVPIGWRHGLVPDAPMVRMLVPPSALPLAPGTDADGNATDPFGGLTDLLRDAADTPPDGKG